MSVTDFQEGTLPASPEEEQTLQAANYQPCRNQLCNYHISPEVTDTAYQSGEGNYQCPHCGHSQDLLKAPGQPGGTTNSGLTPSDQGQIGEDLVEKMGSIPGYGSIAWWHHGGAASNSAADGMVAGWLVEVKTVNWNTQRRRGIINTADRGTKLRAVQNPDIWRAQMNDPSLDAAFHQLGHCKGLLGILVLLDYDTGKADIFARPMPHDPEHQHGGIINFSQTGATQIAQDVPFQSGLPDPRAEGFVPFNQRQPAPQAQAFAKTALDYAGDSRPGETAQALEDQASNNWSFGQPPNVVGDETKEDPAVYTQQYNFFYGNGQLHVSPDHGHADLASHAGVGPDHSGPLASGKVTVDNQAATWHVLTNLGLHSFVKVIKDYSKDQGWRWGGMTDLEGQPIHDDFAGKKSSWHLTDLLCYNNQNDFQDCQSVARSVRQGESSKLAQGDAEAEVGPQFPSVQDAQEIHDQSVAESGQPHAALLNPGGLESAMGRAANHYNYGKGTSGQLIAQSAGALAHGMGMAQAFKDGNKRSAYHTTRYFLHNNGYGSLSPVDQDDEELADHLIGHAEGTHSLEDTQQMFENRLGQQRTAEYPGGSNMNDMMVKHYQSDGEDMELFNNSTLDPKTDDRSWGLKEQDGSKPNGTFQCKHCKKNFKHWYDYQQHMEEENPMGDKNIDEKSKMPPLPDMDAVIPPQFQEYPQFTEASWHLAKDPKDSFQSPIPFIHDIDKKMLTTGFPGQTHMDIKGDFPHNGIVQGMYEPGGKMVLNRSTSRPFSVYNLVNAWYTQHPHLEVTGVHMQDSQGKKQKMAAFDPVQKVKEHVAMDPAVDAAQRALAAAGGQVHVVGGAVRDAVKGEDPKDIDLMVTGLPADITRRALEALPGRVDLTGKDFGVFRYRNKGHDVEIALPRRERSTGATHQDFDVQADHTMSPEEDLARRDFTVNAMAVPLSEHRLIDPFGGANDIRAGRLHAIGESSLRDDPLRVVRALTSNARHGFEPDDETRLQMMQNAGGLNFLPAERIQVELHKIMSSRNPARAMELAHETGVLKHILPEVDQAFGFDQRNKHHSHDLGTHLLNVLDNVSKVTSDPDVRLTALLHDIGKPASAWEDPDTGDLHYYQGANGQGADHESLGATMATDRLKALKFPNTTTDRVGTLIQHHMFPAFNSTKGARKFINRVGDENANDLLNLREADMGGKGTDEYQAQKTPVDTQRSLVQQVREGNEPTSMANLAISGTDLINMGIPQGPAIGATLRRLEQAVIEDPLLNSRDTLLDLARQQ